MSEHVIQNPVPTPEQMAKMLGVSPDRVKILRGIMRSPTTGIFLQRSRATGVTAKKQIAGYSKAGIAGKVKGTTRAKTNAC